MFTRPMATVFFVANVSNGSMHGQTKKFFLFFYFSETFKLYLNTKTPFGKFQHNQKEQAGLSKITKKIWLKYSID